MLVAIVCAAVLLLLPAIAALASERFATRRLAPMPGVSAALVLVAGVVLLHHSR